MADPEKILKVSVVTPDGIVYSHNATMVAMRAIDGERTIMYEMNDRVDHIAVNGGYIEFSNNEATIIADSAERARNIDVERAQSAKKRAEQHMQEAKEKHNEREMLEAEIALRRAVNRLHVRENYGK